MGDGETFVGGCFCGAVRFSVSGPVVVTQTCHCSICRQLHGTSFGVAAACFGADKFEVTAGEDHLGEFMSPRNFSRMFCRDCGTRVFMKFDKADMEIPLVVVYPTLLDQVKAGGAPLPEELSPRQHVFYADRLYDINDGKAKIADAPKEFGGSGRLLNDDGSPIEG